MRHILYSFIALMIVAAASTEAVAATAGATHFMPLDQTALKRKSAIIVPMEKTERQAAPRAGRKFMQLDRQVLTVSSISRARSTKREGMMETEDMRFQSRRNPSVRKAPSRPAPIADIPENASDAVLFLYGDEPIARDHPFNR